MTFLEGLYRFGGAAEVAINDGSAPTYVPEADQRAQVLRLTGTLTAVRRLVVPIVRGDYVIVNDTAQTVVVGAQTGTTVSIGSGVRALICCDGENYSLVSTGGGGGGGGVTVHGALTGLSSDDHTQYLLANGTRALTGPLSAGGSKITSLGTPTAAGDAATKAYVDSVAGGGGVPTTRQVIAGAGLSGGGSLLGDVTVNVGAAADGSISVTADAVGVGVLATDAQHGTRGGGTQHAVATTGAAGFLSAADKAKLDGIATGATATGLSSTSPAAVGTAAVVGVGTTAARSDHVHDHGAQSVGTHHAIATNVLAGFLTPIGGGTYKILASSDGTTQTWTTTPTVTSLRAVSYLEAGTYAAVAASGVGAAAGLIAQGGGAASAGGAAYLAGGAPGSGGSGGGARLYTRGDASGATSGYLHHEVTEIQGRTCIAKFNGVPVTATEFPSGNGVEIIKRALVSPTLPPITGYAIQWVGVSPGELDALVRAGPNGLSYTNHKRLTLAASSSGTIVLGRIREDLGQYAASPQQYKLGQAHGRLHVIMASYGSSWTSGGAGEFSYHGDYHAIRLNQASPSGPPGTWAEMTPTKGALSIALDSSLYLILTVTNQYATQNEAIVSWDWNQPW